MVRLSECGVVDLADEGMKGVGDATKTSSVHEPKKMKPTAAGVNFIHKRKAKDPNSERRP
jgi:hypothetical protein